MSSQRSNNLNRMFVNLKTRCVFHSRTFGSDSRSDDKTQNESLLQVFEIITLFL